MKKDIEFLRVEDIAVAVVPDNEDPQSDTWDVYLINEKEEGIRNILINSKGYGELDGEQKETITFRHFFEELAPKSYLKIEVIREDVLRLANEYWVSFSVNDYMFDKKYIFVQGSLTADNLTRIPFVDQKGVMIR